MKQRTSGDLREMARALLLVPIVLAGLLCAAPAGVAVAQTDTTLAVERRASPVGVLGGTVVWSRETARGTFRLVAWADGRARLLPIPSRRRPFDVDLGPGPDGRLRAVYSRCRREPVYTGGTLNDFGGTGCALYAFDFRTRSERRLRAGRGREPVLPAIWRDRIAFAERVDSPVRIARVVTSRLDGSRRRSVGRGSANRVPADRVGSGRPIRIDLRGGTVVFGWRHGVERCPDGRVEDDPIGDLVTEIWRRSADGLRRVERACGTGEPIEVDSPGLDRSGLSYLRTATPPVPDGPFTTFRHRAAGGPVDEPAPGFPSSAARDGDLTVFSTDVAPGSTRRYEIVLRRSAASTRSR